MHARNAPGCVGSWGARRLGRGGARTVVVIVLGVVLGGGLIAGTVLIGHGQVRTEGPLVAKATFGALGDTPGRFGYPRAIDVAPDGETIFVADKTGRIQRLDVETGECLSVWRMPQTDNGLPVGLTVGRWVDGRDVLYVPDTHYSRVMVYEIEEKENREDTGGTPVPLDLKERNNENTAQRAVPPGRDLNGSVREPVAVIGEYGTEGGEFIYPTDVAVLTDEAGRAQRIYVGEYGGNDRVSAFDAELNYLFSFGRFGLPEDAASEDDVVFARPQSVTIDRTRRELIVADSRNHRLGRFTLDGELIGWVRLDAQEEEIERGVHGRDARATRLGVEEEEAEEAGGYPYAVEWLGDGTTLVVEYATGRLRRMVVDEGRTVGLWGPGLVMDGVDCYVNGERIVQGEGELAVPWAVARHGDDVFIVDSGHKRIVKAKLPGGVGEKQQMGKAPNRQIEQRQGGHGRDARATRLGEEGETW